MTDYVIGFDVGGTRLKSGAVTRGGRLRAPGIQPSGFTMVPRALIKSLREEVRRIAQAMGGPPRAIGLGFPGAVDPAQGVVLLPGKLKGLEGYPIVPDLARVLGLPVVADNDGRLSIRAEARYGLARGLRWVVTLTLGTGVGSGVMLDGRILRDPHLQFGTQLGHVVQQAAGGRRCISGARGTAETLCSASALAMAVRDGLQRGLPSVLGEAYFKDPRAIDFKAVIRGVEKQDALCRDALLQWTEHLGWLLVNAVHVYAPEVIILSGGATNAARHFLEPLQAHVNQHIFRHPVGHPPPVVLSRLRNHQGVLGAAALAWDHAEST